jgi:hypothetical protein
MDSRDRERDVIETPPRPSDLTGRCRGWARWAGTALGAGLAAAALLAPLPAGAQERKNFELPRELTIELRVKAAYNDTDAFFRFEFPSETANVYHDYLYFEGGKWNTTRGSSPGVHPQRLYEDRVSFLLDDGGVRYFDTAGGFLTIHEEMRFLSNQAPAEEVAKHPHLGGVLKVRDVRKYVPETREGADWRSVRSPEEMAALKKSGVFLDLWMWRSHRGGPVGYVDDTWVMEYRNSDAGRGAFADNWDAAKGQPRFMFDPDQMGGQVALRWDDVRNHRLGQQDRYYLAEAFAQPFDPAREWKDGDAIPRRLLRVPEGSRGDITGSGTWQDGRWTVDMKRLLDTGHPDDKALREHRRYNIAFAVHKGYTGSRWHHVSHPYSLGLGVPSDLMAQRFSGDEPPWEEIAWTTVTLFYPGQITWDFLVSPDHAGAAGLLEGRACASCHPAELMGAYAVEHETRDQIRGHWIFTLVASGVLLAGLGLAGIVGARRRT